MKEKLNEKNLHVIELQEKYHGGCVDDNDPIKQKKWGSGIIGKYPFLYTPSK